MNNAALRGMGAEYRFWAKVDKNGPVPVARPGLGRCWVWTAGKFSRGYGAFRGEDSKMCRAHRFSYELIVGPIPDQLVIDHLCKVTSCVNPDHLEPVTNVENVMRGDSPHARLARATHCKKGHPLVPNKDPRRPRHCPRCENEVMAAYRAAKNSTPSAA